MEPLLGFCVLLSAMAGTPDRIRVSTAAELIAAIGPNRTIELAAGDYDLGATPRAPTPYVRWTETDWPVGLTVHDVDGLRISGPEEGIARLFATRSAKLEFSKVRGLVLNRLTIGRPDGSPRFDRARDERVLLGPSIHQSRDVTIEDVRTLATGCSPLRLSEVEGARIARFRDGGCSGLNVLDGSGLRIDDALFRSPIWVNGGSLRRVTVETAASASAGIDVAVGWSAGSAIMLEDVRLVDAITGKVRRAVGLGKATETLAAPAPEAEAVDFVLTRSAPEGDDPHEAQYRLRMKLEDGREALAEMTISRGMGLEPGSIRARRLGDARSPILITWEDVAQGQGNYQVTFYQVLGPGPTDGVLLQGSMPISGHAAGGTSYSGQITITLEGGFLTVRGEGTGSDTSDEQAPGWILEQEGGHTYIREWAFAGESIYRYEEGRLEALRFEEYVRLEPGVDPAELAKQGYRPVWPHREGSPPRSRAWWKRVLSAEEGEKRHPRLGSIGADEE